MRRWWILGLMSLAGFGGSLPSISTFALVSEALRPGARAGLEDEQAEQLIALGAEEQENHPAAAFDKFQEALRLARESHADWSEARALTHSGQVAMDLSELGAAGSFYRQALKKWETLGSSTGRLEALQGLAAFHLLRGEPARAVLFLEQAREIDPDQAGVLRLFGIAFLEDGREGFALQVLRGALRQARQEEDASLQATLLGDIGSVALRLGEIEQAAAAFEEGFQISVASHFRAGEAYARAGRGRVLGAQGRFEQAMKELGLADASFRSLGQAASLALVLAGEALLEKEQGNFQRALELSSESIDLIESERREIAGPRARAHWLGAWSDPYELQIDVLWHLSRRNRGRAFEARAFEVSERIRARTLYEGLAAPRDISRPGAAELERQRREVTIRLRALEREKLRLSSSSGKEVRSQRLDIETDLRELIAKEGSLSERLRQSDPRSALVALQPFDLEQVQALLDPDTAFLVYTLGRERSFVWWIDRSSLTMRELPSRRDIEAVAGQVQSLLSGTATRRELRQVDDLLAQMSEIVLGPLADKLPRVRRLAIVPDGALQALPFAALPRPDAKGRATEEPLLVSHVATFLPSPSILGALRRREAERTVQPDKLIAAIVDPVFEPDDERLARQPQSPSNPLYPGLQRLRQTGGEARSILGLVPKGMGRIIEGFDAVPEVVLEPDFRRYRYLHFGAHGVVDSKQAELSGIVLSQMTPNGGTRDGILRFYDVYDLDLPVDLVSLSTCRSAIGPQIRREGPITMTRSFFYAGASRVLGTLWEVSDRPAAELTATFYKGVLREGKTPAEALHDAQNAMREDGWPLQSWAPFVLQGDWR